KSSARNCIFAGNLYAGNLNHSGNLHETTREAAGLGDLGFHGGFTRTISLSTDSPAIDHGLSADLPQYDQRGEPFLRKVGSAPDAGAFERQLSLDDLVVGLETEPGYDAPSGLYFQFVIVHNDSPWALSGFRLEVAELPADVTLYNASGGG